jgi:hypothetical protein
MKIHQEEESMKWRSGVLLALAFALSVSVVPLHAQTSAATKSTIHPWYDISQEVRISGTVSVVEKTPARGTEAIVGSHLIVETSAGKVNASLGRYALKGKSPLSLSSGQQVQMLGVMKTVRDQQVFVARVIQVSGHQYTIRTEHGLATAGIAHGKPSTGTNGGTL